MSHNQKDELLITNNQRDQQNSGSQPNQNQQKNESDKTVKVPEMDKKITPEIPEKLHVKEHEQDFNKPVSDVDGLNDIKSESIKETEVTSSEKSENANQTESQNSNKSAE